MTELFERALAAHRAGDYAAAERGYLAIRHFTAARHNLGALYNEIGRRPEAEAALRPIVAAYPDHSASRHSLAMTLLARGSYAEAWPLHEARRPVLEIADPEADFPEWRGEPLSGKRLVVVAEQGFGDQLMFGRYLSALQDQGAQVLVACDPRAVARVLERAGFETRAHFRSRSSLPEGDYWTFFGSLPYRLGAEAPAPPVYLPTTGEGGGGVGVVARGHVNHQHDAHRSMDPEAADALLSLGRNLLPQATGALDFLDTAEIIGGLDLVVTVDTSVAHLAGSMGKACWVLLPRIGLDWRWNDARRSDWYPQMRLFQQPAPGDWSSVLGEVRGALKSL